MLTIKQIAEITGLTVPQINYLMDRYTTVYKLFKMVKIKSNKRAKKQYVIDDDDLVILQDFIKKLKEERENKKPCEKTKIHWTRSAIDCYNANLICRNCMQYNIVCKRVSAVNSYGLKPMKKMVLELFSLYGKPPEKPEEQTDV